MMVDSAGFSAEGDSGSLIVDSGTAEPVALLFAGDAVSTVANPISDDLAALVDSNNVQPTFVGGAEHAVAACSLPPASATAPTEEPAVAAEVILTPRLRCEIVMPSALRRQTVCKGE